MPLLALFAFGVLAGRSIARTLKMHIAFASRSAAAENELLAIAGQIDYGLRLAKLTRRTRSSRAIVLFGIYNRSHGHLYDLGCACAAGHFLPHSGRPVLCLDDRLVKQRSQIIDVAIGPQNHIPAPPAVAAIGAAFGHKFLPAKTDAAAPAIAGLGKNSNAIDKHRFLQLQRSMVAQLKRRAPFLRSLQRLNVSTFRTTLLFSPQSPPN